MLNAFNCKNGYHIYVGASCFNLIYFSDEVWLDLLRLCQLSKLSLLVFRKHHEHVKSGPHPEKIGIWSRILRKKIVVHSFLKQQMGRENDKHAIWCPHVENHLEVIEEAANACITFDVIIHHHR